MNKLFLTRQAKEELKKLRPGEQQEVARAISLLADDRFREQNKVDFCLVEEDCRVWGFFVGRISLAFVETSDGIINVIHLALLSRFRAP